MIKLKGGDTDRSRMMAKALGGGGGGAPEDPNAPNPHGNALAKKLGFRTRDTRARVEVKKGPEGPLIYLDSKDAYRHEREQLDEDSSDLSDFDEGDTALSRIREARMSELKQQFQNNQRFRSLGHGEYAEISQDEFLPAVTASKYCVVHFYHEEFTRCKIIDKHLNYLAPKHMATRFCKLDATKSPFFVQKLQVKTLPTLVIFKDGKSVDRVVGFDDLGGTDEFTSVTLAARIATSGCLLLDKLIDECIEDNVDDEGY